MTEITNNPQASSLDRCVVLVPLERIDTAVAIAHKFEIQASYEHETPLAMAEICLLFKQAQEIQEWDASTQTVRLILMHASELPGVTQMLAGIRKYLPNVVVSELRDGRIEEIKIQRSVVDSITEMPVVHSESVDAEELSMLLYKKPQEVDE